MSRTFGQFMILAGLFLCLSVAAQFAHAAQQDAQVSWTTPTVNASAVTGYIVERKTGTTGTYAQVGTTAATVLTFTDPNLAQGSTFCYHVITTSAIGNGPANVEACANTAGTPGAAGNTTVQIIIK